MWKGKCFQPKVWINYILNRKKVDHDPTSYNKNKSRCFADPNVTAKATEFLEGKKKKKSLFLWPWDRHWAEWWSPIVMAIS